MSRNSKRQRARKPAGFEHVYVSSTLKGAAQAMDDAGRAMAFDCFQHYRREMHRIRNEDPASVAHTVHLMVDDKTSEMIAKSEHGPDISCRKGCAACCHLNVGITPHEADLLLMFTREESVAIDWERLALQAGKDDDTWRELTPENQRCVFLADDKTCTVYEVRPGACRKYFVKGDPDLCDMQKHPGGAVAIVFSAEAEIIHSAAMTEHGAGNLAAMLLLKGSPKT